MWLQLSPLAAAEQLMCLTAVATDARQVPRRTPLPFEKRCREGDEGPRSAAMQPERPKSSSICATSALASEAASGKAARSLARTGSTCALDVWLRRIQQRSSAHGRSHKSSSSSPKAIVAAAKEMPGSNP